MFLDWCWWCIGKVKHEYEYTYILCRIKGKLTLFEKPRKVKELERTRINFFLTFQFKMNYLKRERGNRRTDRHTLSSRKKKMAIINIKKFNSY